MLVLKRREGQWVEVVHKSGDILRLRMYHIVGPPGRLDVAFDDDAHNFIIQRPERVRKEPAHVEEPAGRGPLSAVVRARRGA